MELAIFLIIGTVSMLAAMLLERIDYKIPIWKTVIVSILFTIAGVAGAKLMRLIEERDFNGVSFYGAVFFAPIVMMLVALVLRIQIRTVLDMCAPAECIMLAILKVKCFVDGCCSGKHFFFRGIDIIFPSQLVEMLSGIVIMFVLLILMRYECNHGKLYAWYLLLYGVTRFFWNSFRIGLAPFVWILPAGHFWSIISVFLGISWLAFAKYKQERVRRRMGS